MDTQSRTAILAELPPAPPGKTGWPWTEETPLLPEVMPDGAPWPRITVVTPSYNQAQYLEETIRSVLLQGYPDLEYLVMDGGSTDGSPDIIKRYAPWITYWTSAPDGGQTQAIAAGLERATGELFNWINSDDLLTPGALATVAGSICSANWIAGGLEVFGGGIAPHVSPSRLCSIQELMLQDAGYDQPSTWLRTDLVRLSGGLNVRYQYAFDKELMIRYMQRCGEGRSVPDVLARFRLHSGSKTVTQKSNMIGEMLDIVEKAVALGYCRGSGARVRERIRDLKWSKTLSELMSRQMSPVPRVLAILLAAVHNPVGAMRRRSGLREALGACRRGGRYRLVPVIGSQTVRAPRQKER